MRVVVTGGAGYVGSHAVKELKRRGYGVIVYDNLSRGRRWAVRGDEFVEGDVADEEKLRRLFSSRQADAVLHFAAFAYVGESVEEPRKYYENNVRNSLNLLKAMLDHGVKLFVFSSSCAVYGLPEQLPIREDHPLKPESPYGMSKLMVERVLADYDRAHGLRYVSLRYFNASGADPEGELGEDHDPETHLIPIFLQTALGLRPRAEIYGTDYPTQDGTCVRDYVHVADLAAAHVLALEWLGSKGRSEVINLGTGRGHSVMEVLEVARRLTGHPIPVVPGRRRPGDPPVLLASHERAERLLGWKPGLSNIEEIIGTAWKWHRSRRM